MKSPLSFDTNIMGLRLYYQNHSRYHQANTVVCCFQCWMVGLSQVSPMVVFVVTNNNYPHIRFLCVYILQYVCCIVVLGVYIIIFLDLGFRPVNQLPTRWNLQKGL